MKYDTLLFDADATLYDFKAAEKQAFMLTMKKYGLNHSEACYELYSKINDDMWKRLERGEIGKDELRVKRFDEYASASNQILDAEKTSHDYTDNLAEMGILFDGAMDVIQTVSKRIECSIASNGIGYVQRRRFQKSGIEPYFKHLFISEELKAEKPDLKFFRSVEQVLGIKDPKRILFVGDSLSADIKGGVMAGWTTVWYNPEHIKNTTEYQPDYEIDDLLQVIELINE